jgi:hypothetical protein
MLLVQPAPLLQQELADGKLAAAGYRGVVWSCLYISMAFWICLRSDFLCASLALSRAPMKLGRRRADSIPIIAITTRSSTRVKPLRILTDYNTMLANVK